MPREKDRDRGPQALRRHVQARRGQPIRRLIEQGLSQGAVPGGQMSLGGGEQPPRTILRVRGQLRRPGQERGLRDIAAAPFGPRGGTFQVGRDALVRDDGRRRAVPRGLIRVAVIGADARPGIVDPAPVAQPGLPRRPRSGSAGAGTPPAARATGCPGPALARRRRDPSPAAPPPATSAAGSSPDAAEASSSSKRVAGGSVFTWRRKCPCMPWPTGSHCGSGERPASWPGVSSPTTSSRASGLPPVSAMIRAATRALSGPATLAASRARAAPGSSPPRRRVGSPSSAVSPGEGSRTPKSKPVLSAYRRRPTKPSTSSDSLSSHCASSTSQISGCSAAAPASSVRAPRPTRNLSAGGPVDKPNAEPSASRCGAGSAPIPSRKGTSMRCSAAKPSRSSDSTPLMLTVRSPVAASAAYRRRLVFPIPASPVITRDRLRPPRIAVIRSSSARQSALRPTSASGSIRASGKSAPAETTGPRAAVAGIPRHDSARSRAEDDAPTRSASGSGSRLHHPNSGAAPIIAVPGHVQKGDAACSWRVEPQRRPWSFLSTGRRPGTGWRRRPRFACRGCRAARR